MNSRSLIFIIILVLSVGNVCAEQFNVVTFPAEYLRQTSFVKVEEPELGRKLACGLSNMYRRTKGQVQFVEHEVEAGSDEVLNLADGVVLRPIPHVAKGIDLFGVKVVLYGANDEVLEISAIGSTDSRLTGDWLKCLAEAYLAAHKTLRDELYGDGASNYRWIRHIAAQLSSHLYENRCYGFLMSEERRLEAVKTLILESDVIHRANNSKTYLCFVKRVGEISVSGFTGFRAGKTIGLDAARILKEIVEGGSDVGAAGQKQVNKGLMEDLDLIGTRNVTGK